MRGANGCSEFAPSSGWSVRGPDGTPGAVGVPSLPCYQPETTVATLRYTPSRPVSNSYGPGGFRGYRPRITDRYRWPSGASSGTLGVRNNSPRKCTGSVAI